MSIGDFKEWLNKKINLEDIDCVGDYRFELVERYP